MKLASGFFLVFSLWFFAGCASTPATEVINPKITFAWDTLRYLRDKCNHNAVIILETEIDGTTPSSIQVTAPEDILREARLLAIGELVITEDFFLADNEEAIRLAYKYLGKGMFSNVSIKKRGSINAKLALFVTGKASQILLYKEELGSKKIMSFFALKAVTLPLNDKIMQKALFYQMPHDAGTPAGSFAFATDANNIRIVASKQIVDEFVQLAQE